MVNSIPKLSVDPLLLQLIATPAPGLAPVAAAAPAAAPTPASAAAATTALHSVFTSGSTQPRRGGGVGRTHTIIRLQTRIRRKDGTENFGGFVYVLDGFLQRDFVLWVFMCSINWRLISVSLFSGYHADSYHTPPIPHGLSRPGLSRLSPHCTAIYIPAITP